MSEQNCETCCYFVVGKDDGGSCTRFPPMVPIMAGTQMSLASNKPQINYQWTFPMVSKDAKCGEFKQMKENPIHNYKF